MNHRIHLMRRIDIILPNIYSPAMRKLLLDAHRSLAADEDEITDLYSRLNFLEDEIKRYPPSSPDDDKD